VKQNPTTQCVSIVPEYDLIDAATGLDCYDSSDLDISSDSSSDELEESPTPATEFTVTNQLPPAQTPTSQQENSLSPAFPHDSGHASNPHGTSTPRETTSQESYSPAEPHPLGGAKGRILKYAMDLSRAPTRMQEFLAEIKLHFTKEVNLERNSPPIAKATFSKAQERLLCGYLIYYSTYLHA
jgi:hypothetical protein